MSTMNSISSLKGVGPNTESLLKKVGVSTVEDVLNYFPRRYDDFSHITTISEIEPGACSLKVKIDSVSSRYAKRGLHITEAVVSDETGKLKVVWFNQRYREKQFEKSEEYFLSGEYGFAAGRFTITNPALEKVSGFQRNTARIVPIYPETKGLKSHQLRRIITQALDIAQNQQDNLQPLALDELDLLSHYDALTQIHYPDNPTLLKKAKYRLGFEEIFELSLASLLNKRAIKNNKGPRVSFSKDIASQFVESLPFKLTDSQRLASWEILKDLDTTTPMNRLLEGDVGSGKTVVAAMAALMAVKAGYQVAYMAPTEILAKQQLRTLEELLRSFDIEVTSLLGAQKKSERDDNNLKISNGEAHIVIGTHALIQDSAKFMNLGLIVIDEQHRFGVEQRKKLQKKASVVPHVLTMTATPIPRSLALVVYGELDISLLKELPAGRIPIETTIESSASREQINIKIEQQLAKGRQVYIICPLVNDSETLGIKSAESEYKLLSKGRFKDERIGLVHI